MPVYALANQKGGVGKTTTAVNLAACLAEAGERALVVDLDPQANATSGLGERANGVLELRPARRRAAERRAATRFANLDLVPAKPDLAGAAVELARREATPTTTWPRPSTEPTRPLRLRLRRLPALARPADGQRARRRRPRARAGAGRVLRARGPLAAARVGRTRPRAAEPAARARGRAPDDGRRPHEARRRRRAEVERHFGDAASSARPCPAPCASPRRRATAAGDRLRPPLRRAPRRTGRWRWSLSSAPEPAAAAASAAGSRS